MTLVRAIPKTFSEWRVVRPGNGGPRMAVKWYLCPYDVEVISERVTRSPAIYRYIPGSLTSDTFEEWEILGSHLLVRVDASPLILTQIGLDADFVEIPESLSAKDAKINGVLLGLGYSQAELDATGWTFKGLAGYIPTQVNPIGKNAEGTGVEVKPGKIPPHKPLDGLTAILNP